MNKLKDSEGNEIPGGEGTHIVVFEVSLDMENEEIVLKRMDSFSCVQFSLKSHQAMQLSMALAMKCKQMVDEGLKKQLRNYSVDEGMSN